MILQGLAKHLVGASEILATQQGVKCLYVHVVQHNAAAKGLYLACGFEVEAEESVDLARKRQHERRLLLGRQC
jgi:ribosomal protein S18 acetylase RimI-like enzyme